MPLSLLKITEEVGYTTGLAVNKISRFKRWLGVDGNGNTLTTLDLMKQLLATPDEPEMHRGNRRVYDRQLACDFCKRPEAVPGNGNIVNGRVMCDYCCHDHMDLLEA